jgi:hypothetical protein
MAVLSKTTKGKLGLFTVGAAVKNPGVTRLFAKATVPVAKTGARLGKGIAKRATRQRVERVGQTARSVGEVVAIYVPEAMQMLGWMEPPKPKRTTPRVMVGVVIGATGMYLLEPGAPGKEHRAKVLALVS